MSFKAFMNKNGSTIAMIGSIGLIIGTVFMAVKKSKEGAQVHDEYEKQMASADGNAQLEAEAKVNYIKKSASVYKEAIVCACGAIILAYISHRSDAKKIANLGATLALNEDKVKKVYNYIERKLEPNGMTRRDIEKDIAEKDTEHQFDPPVKAKKRYRKEEPVTFQDSFSGTRYESTMRDYEAAVDRAELILTRYGAYGLGYNKWRGLLGLEDIPAGATNGWRASEFRPYLQEAIIDGQPVYVICYKEFPNSNYWK